MKNEFLRKFVVSLKRKPQNIALFALLISFLIYSLNLTAVSDTTAKIQGAGMGFCGFCTMLASILSFVCFINAFPHRKKVNVPMLVLLLVMFAVTFTCDGLYLRAITRALTRAESPIRVEDFPAAGKAMSVLTTHIISQCVTIALIAAMPLYRKWLRSIKTSVDVEDNGNMDAIDLAD